MDCYNNADFEQMREDAIKATKERNPSAFKTKMTKVNDEERHSTGCNCKKSMCLKKYCECFEAAVMCGDQCKCKSCQNFEGSEALEAARLSKERKSGSIKTLTHTPRHTPRSLVHVHQHRTQLQFEHNMPYATPYPNVSIYRRPVVDDDNTSSSDQNQNEDPNKQMQLTTLKGEVPKYSFFGAKNPALTKLTALRVLQFLDNKDLYALSQVNRLCSHLAVDEAVWEFH